jgi:hypothetical protein
MRTRTWVGTFSDDPASPTLLTSKGPHNALTYSSLQSLVALSEKAGTKRKDTGKALLLDLSEIAALAVLQVSVLAGHPRTFGV